MRTIDADALLELYADRLQKLEERYGVHSGECGVLAGAMKLLEIQPTIEPERKRGQWINHRNDNGHNIADCNICGNSIQWFDDDEKPRFCCMCGADNRGEECGKNN